MCKLEQLIGPAKKPIERLPGPVASKYNTPLKRGLTLVLNLIQFSPVLHARWCKSRHCAGLVDGVR